MSIKYVTGDLFSAKNCAFLHACNCQRTWGRGVAAEMARRFPKSYGIHKGHKPTLGDIQVIFEPSEMSEGRGAQSIVCLFTSEGYGQDTDPSHLILENTKSALLQLGRFYQSADEVNIASPKINAGLFRVPWEDTENLICEFLKDNKNFTWTVYCL